MPQVQYKGVQMQQTLAILRMIGVEHGFYDPKDWQAAGKIDMVCESFNNILGSIFTGKPAKLNPVIEKSLRPFLLMVEGMLATKAEQGSSTKFIVGEKVTIADICMFCLFHNSLMNPIYAGYALTNAEMNSGKYPKVLAYAASLEQEFADYAASRPQKKF